MSVAIGRSPSDIPEIYVNGVMGGAHCSTFVSAEENRPTLTRDREILFMPEISINYYFETVLRGTPFAAVAATAAAGLGGRGHAARPSIGPVRRLFLLH